MRPATRDPREAGKLQRIQLLWRKVRPSPAVSCMQIQRGAGGWRLLSRVSCLSVFTTPLQSCRSAMRDTRNTVDSSRAETLDAGCIQPGRSRCTHPEHNQTRKKACNVISIIQSLFLSPNQCNHSQIIAALPCHHDGAELSVESRVKRTVRTGLSIPCHRSALSSSKGERQLRRGSKDEPG